MLSKRNTYALVGFYQKVNLYEIGFAVVKYKITAAVMLYLRSSQTSILYQLDIEPAVK